MDRRLPSAAELLESNALVPEHVVYRSFEAETLLLNLETSQYHGLNPTGGRMLELLQETDGDVGLAVQRLAGEYDVEAGQIAGDLAEFCLALLERGLLELRDHGRG